MKKKEYTVRQLKKLMEILEGTESDRVQEVLGSGILSDVFDPNAKFNRCAVRRALELISLPSTLGRHIVDYNMTFEEMMAAGNYAFDNKNINAERFPVVGKGRVEFQDAIFHFGRHILVEDAVKQILAVDPKNPWEPGKIENILAYGVQNHEEWLRFIVTGLGSVGTINGQCCVPCLDVSRRKVGINLFCFGLDTHYVLLGVRRKFSTVSASSEVVPLVDDHTKIARMFAYSFGPIYPVED